MKATFLWIVGLAAVVLLVGAIVVDAGGRNVGHDHAGPVPLGTTQLAADAYLVQDVRQMPEVCGKEGLYSQPTKVADLEGVYVVCVDDQRWNDSRDVSPNYGTALVRVAQSDWFLGAFGCVMALFSVVCSVSVIRSAVTTRRLDRERANRRQTTRTEQLETLAVSHAKGKITLDEHDAAVARMLKKDDDEGLMV